MTDDDFEVDIQDLASDEIHELLLEAGADISAVQAEQLTRFVTQAGGIDDALYALDQLAQRRHAA